MGEAAENQSKVDTSSTMARFLEVVRDSSKRGLAASAKNDQILILELSSQLDLSFDHWVSVIVLHSKAFKLAFSIRFTSRVARHVTASALATAPQSIQPTMAHDNMCEFCNLAVGFIKQYFVQSARTEFGEANMTTPKSRPSFDLAPMELEKNECSDSWILDFSGNQVVCAAKIEVMDWQLLATMTAAELSQVSISDEGEVEFF